jgi:hypothetical protein
MKKSDALFFRQGRTFRQGLAPVGHQRFRPANICANLELIRGKNLSEQFGGDCVLIRNSHDA